MKPKPDFEPMFQADQKRRRRPIRGAAVIVIAIALSGMSLRAGPIPARRPASPLRPVLVQGGAANPQTGKTQAADRFVIAAPAELDRAMVVRARDDIDPAMVFNPETGRRRVMPNGPAPVIVAPAPGQAPPR